MLNLNTWQPTWQHFTGNSTLFLNQHTHHATLVNDTHQEITIIANHQLYSLIQHTSSSIAATDKIFLSLEKNQSAWYFQWITADVEFFFLSENPLLTHENMPAFNEILKDFCLLSGMTPQRIKQLSKKETDEDIDAVYVNKQHAYDFVLPALSTQLDIIKKQWQKTRDTLDSNERINSIPRVIHFVWIKSTPGHKITPLKQSHLWRAMSWLHHHKERMEYWLWTDASEESELNIQLLRDYADTLGITNRFHVKSIYEIHAEAKKHFNVDRCLINCTLPNTTKTIAYHDIFSAWEMMVSRHQNVGARSDVLKLMLLYLYGGLYVDINDTECLHSFEELLSKGDFFACMEPQGFINTAIIACKQHTEVILSYLLLLWWQRDQTDATATLLEHYAQRLNTLAADHPDQSRLRNAMDRLVVRRTGPIALTKVILGLLPLSDRLENIVVLPSAYWYPGWGVMQTHTKRAWLKPVSYANHYDERAYVGHTNTAANNDIAVACGLAPGSSCIATDGYLSSFMEINA